MRGSAWKIILLTLSVAGAAQADECKPDVAAADAHFSDAFKAIFDYQGFAWACAPYIGDDLAKSSTVHVESLLEDSGASPNEAVIQAHEFNDRARSAGENSGMVEQMQNINATRQEAMIACSQLMDEEYQKFRVAKAKMRKAQCDHR